MPRFKLTIEYAGTRYSGWQIQKNARTIQGEIDARRADGHRAQGFRAVRIGPHRCRRSRARAGRPPGRQHESAGRNAAPAAERRAAGRHQHPRRRRRCRTGFTLVTTRSRAGTCIRLPAAVPPSPRRTSGGCGSRSTSARCARPAAPSRACAISSRSPSSTTATSGEPARSTVVLVDRLDFVEDGDLVLVGVEGSHFLWKMVRRMVGVLVEIGRGGLKPDAAARFLVDASATPARLTAPPSGLFLDRVYYENDIRDGFLRAATPLR